MLHASCSIIMSFGYEILDLSLGPGLESLDWGERERGDPIVLLDDVGRFSIFGYSSQSLLQGATCMSQVYYVKLYQRAFKSRL
jgi:hypothetical protein